MSVVIGEQDKLEKENGCNFEKKKGKWRDSFILKQITLLEITTLF